MIEYLDKIFGLLVKPITLVIQYFQKRPELTLTIKGDGSAQGPSHIPGAIYFRWQRELVVHNDSGFLVRGIKVLTPFPKPWIMQGEFPTRLEPDQKISVPIKASLEEDHQQLLDRFGKNMQGRLAAAIFPGVIANVTLEIELKNEHGRTVYQYSSFREDGWVDSQTFSKRRANGG